MKHAFTAALLPVVLLVAACNGGDGVIEPGGSDQRGIRLGPGASLSVTPPLDTLAPGDRTHFVAHLRDADGHRLSDPTVRWTVADASIARIDSVGDAWVILRALRLGGTTVTAMTSGRTASARLVVDSVPRDTTGGPGGSVASVTVTPPGDTIAVGDSASFFAELRDAEGNPIFVPGSCEAVDVTWTVNDSTVARIADQCGQWVLVRGLREGLTTVTATAGGQSGTAQLVVTDSTPSESVATVIVTPAR